MTISYKQYLILLVLTVSLLLGIVAFVNYQIDPARIYREIDKLHGSTANAFAYRLVTSSNGLLWPNNSWNERDIKKSMADNNNINAACAVIGSSHVFQISSFRGNASLENTCPTIMNFGVSGGTLEDYLALSYMLINKKNKPKTIVFGIDPWALRFRSDPRWERYKEFYSLMRTQLNQNILSESSNSFKYIFNLINLQYFYRSIQTIGVVDFIIEEAPEFNVLQGIKYPVYLPDGSLVYSKKFITESAESIISTSGSNYKIKKNSQYSDSAVLLFKKLVHLLRRVDSINVVILMTPYHPEVWADENSLTTQALLEMETKIRRVGKDISVKVLGSYNPYKIGCTPDEFYDHMHAKAKCLEKIDNFSMSDGTHNKTN